VAILYTTLASMFIKHTLSIPCCQI